MSEINHIDKILLNAKEFIPIVPGSLKIRYGEAKMERMVVMTGQVKEVVFKKNYEDAVPGLDFEMEATPKAVALLEQALTALENLIPTDFSVAFKGTEKDLQFVSCYYSGDGEFDVEGKISFSFDAAILNR